MGLEIIHRFSTEKNALLKKQRGIGFDDIIFALENDFLLDTIDHPSPKYPRQKMYVIEIRDYVYLVPYVENNNEVFLKTLYPSREMTKRYLQKDKK